MKEPLGLYVYPLAMLAALAGLVVSLQAGMMGSISGEQALLGALLSLLTGWAAAARFDRLERNQR